MHAARPAAALYEPAAQDRLGFATAKLGFAGMVTVPVKAGGDAADVDCTAAAETTMPVRNVALHG